MTSGTHGPSEFDFTAFSGADLLAVGDDFLSCGDSFTLPVSATTCITVQDNDGSLSGDAYCNEHGDDHTGQVADIQVNGELVLEGVRIYAEQYYVVRDEQGRCYTLIEIEVAGTGTTDRDDYYAFLGDVPPAGASLTVVGTGNVVGNWVTYRQLSAGLKWLPGDDGKITIEAEDMELWNYRIDDVDAASGGEVIRLKRHQGEASLVFGADSGVYDLQLAYIDENDGEGEIEILVNGNLVAAIDLTANNNGNGNDHSTISTFTVADLQLDQGDQITVRGTRDAWEFARIDALTFCPNRPPEATDDSFTVGENGLVTGNVLDNDSDPDGDTLTVTLSSGVALGVLLLNPDGTFDYDPDGAFESLAVGESATTTFSYQADDGRGGSDTATVTITIAGENDAPLLGGAMLASVEDGPVVSLDLATLADDIDSDDDGTTLVYAVTGAPAEGTAAIVGTTLSFDPGADFQNLADGETRDVTIQVTATDSHGATAVNDISVTVTGANDAPVAGADIAATDEDTALTIDVLANDIDVDSDDGPATFSLDSIDSVTVSGIGAAALSTGSVTIVGNQVQFDPGGDFNELNDGDTATVSVGYTMSDDSGASSTATLTITVTGANDGPPNSPPIANPAAFAGLEDQAIAGELTASDDDNDPLVYSLLSGPVSGQVVVNADGTFVYTPVPHLSGDDSFVFAVTDGEATDSATATLTIEAVADAPIVTAADASGDEDTLIPLDLSAVLVDLDGSETLSEIRLSVPFGVQLSAGAVQPDGSVLLSPADLVGLQLRPPPNFSGDLTLTLAATATETSNGDTATASKTFVVSVAEINDPPSPNVFFGPSAIFVDQFYEFTFGADAFVDDDNGQALTYSVTQSDGSPLPGWLNFDPLTRTFTGTPGTDDVGVIAVRVTATEPDGLFSSAVFTITTLDGNVIDGTPGRDALTGTINGDLIRGFEDRDTLAGDTGADLIEGGSGDDQITGGTGNDALLGGIGDDRLEGGTGDDILIGGEGNDYLDGEKGNNYLLGGAGDDVIWVKGDVDIVLGGEGNDTINLQIAGFNSTRPTTDIIDAGAGDDVLRLARYHDGVLTLGEGSDTISVNAESDGRFPTVTDFQTGPGGDVIQLFLATLNGPIGYDGSENPFPEYLRLTQSGVDTHLEFDRDGNGNSFSFETLILLENTQAASFTKDNFDPGFNPQGGPTPGETITGTNGDDSLVGTVGDDEIFGLDGNDTIRSGVGNDTVDGGNGNDNLFGQFGSNTLLGGAGDDSLTGAAGNDVLDGGPGNDRILQGGGGRDVIRAGEGDDFIVAGGSETIRQDIDAGPGNDSISIDNSWFAANGEGLFLTLGDGQDTVTYLRTDNLEPGLFVTIRDFESGPGGDKIDYYNTLFTAVRSYGYDGIANPYPLGFVRLRDAVEGVYFEIDEDGAETATNYRPIFLVEGVSASALTSDNFNPDFAPDGTPSPATTILGTANAEELLGTSGADTIQGQGGADSIRAGFGSDVVEGGVGNDWIWGDPGNDTLFGGDGSDRLFAVAGNNQLFGGNGSDRLSAGTEGDYLDGGAGNDSIFANTGGTHTIIGGDGADEINASGAGTTVDAGSGADELIINPSPGYIEVTLGTGSDFLRVGISNVSGRIADIVDFEASLGGDVLDLVFLIDALGSTYDGISNPFAAGYLRFFDEGNDAYLGVDRFSDEFGGLQYFQFVRFQGLSGDDFTSDNFNIAINPDGSGVLGQDNDGSNGSDILPGTVGDDTLSGLDGNDALTGGNGNDWLIGGAGIDQLEGSFGRDTLDGGSDADTLIGGDRADLLTGGSDADQFVYNNVFDGKDTITDFEVGLDHLVVQRSGFGLTADPQIAIGAGAAPTTGTATVLYDTATGDVSIDLDGTGGEDAYALATLTGAPTLTVDDFLFV